MPEQTQQIRIETPSRNLIVVHGLTVNYDQTPTEAIKGLPDNNSLIASSFPQALWNGGKSGIVEGVTIPIYWPRQSFSTSGGRQMQSEIGYGLPAELAALRSEDVRKALWDAGIWALVALQEKDEGLWLDPYGYLRPVVLRLVPCCRGFRLGSADVGWDDSYALVGAPQV